MPAILFLLAFGVGVYGYGSIFFEQTPVQASRATYAICGPNPFPESIAVAEYIRKHSKKEDKIAVLGSEAQIYFYSKRQSAAPYIYTYQMMETEPYAPRMQREMVEEIERSRPAYLVFVNVFASWLVRPKSERLLFRWFEEYATREFDLVGVVDILSETRTEYRWDRGTVGYVPRSPHFLWIFKRKNA